MKILFFIESLNSGGKERRLVELIKGLRNYPDIETELVLIKEGIHYKDIYDTGIKIHYTIRKRMSKDPGVFLKFYKIVKKFNPDIIHVWGNMPALYALPSKLLLNKKLVNNQITDAPEIKKGGFLSHKLSFIFSDSIVANSKAGLKSYNAPEKKSYVIYNGFNFLRLNNLSEKSKEKERLNICAKFIIGMVATFSKVKDYNTYINMANIILDHRKDIVFLCVGSGDYSKYQNLVKLENTKNVLFIGPSNRVESLMNICDIGVLSTHFEGMPNSVLEFMALGKPVVATGKGGTNELIVNGKNGILIESQNAQLLASKILQLINDSKLRNSLGFRAKETIIKKFNIDRIIKSNVELYKKLLS